MLTSDQIYSLTSNVGVLLTSTFMLKETLSYYVNNDSIVFCSFWMQVKHLTGCITVNCFFVYLLTIRFDHI